MAHPTAEPVEILITRPSQKIKSREPTHQNLPHRGYFKNILGLKPLDFILEHPKGVLANLLVPPCMSENDAKGTGSTSLHFDWCWILDDFGELERLTHIFTFH
jgi:hypothetical protein